jgi:hypothetical protein
MSDIRTLHPTNQAHNKQFAKSYEGSSTPTFQRAVACTSPRWHIFPLRNYRWTGSSVSLSTVGRCIGTVAFDGPNTITIHTKLGIL